MRAIAEYVTAHDLVDSREAPNQGTDQAIWRQEAEELLLQMSQGGRDFWRGRELEYILQHVNYRQREVTNRQNDAREVAITEGLSRTRKFFSADRGNYRAILLTETFFASILLGTIASAGDDWRMIAVLVCGIAFILHIAHTSGEGRLRGQEERA